MSFHVSQSHIYVYCHNLLNKSLGLSNVSTMDSIQSIRDPWNRIEVLTEQCLRLANAKEPYVPLQIPDMMSWLLSRLSNSYFGDEAAFAASAFKKFSKAAHKVKSRELSYKDIYSLTFYPDKKNLGDRRAPGFAEATLETIRRLRDMREIENVLSKSSVGGIVGGSMSYGKFLNVKGGEDASDLDILLVVDSWNNVPDVLLDLKKLPFTSDKDIEYMTRRIGSMLSEWKHEKEIVFSGKISFWAEEKDPMLGIFELNVSPKYQLSLHFMSREGADIMLLKNIQNIVTTDNLESEQFLDYRESEPKRPDFQRTFTGESLGIEIPFEERVDGDVVSYVRSTSSFVVENGHFYPGMLQGLVLPAFDIMWGDSKFRRLVASFRWKLIERLRYEKNAFPNNTLRLSFAHTRSDVFANHVKKAIDSTTNLR